MNGFAVINKPSGISSSDAVIKCRNALSKAIGCKIKCGHMGTLDPLASGVLLVAFGNTNRLFDFLLKKEKSYVATFEFGEERDTLDAEGTVTEKSELPQLDKILACTNEFIGEIDQIPPKYSAVNINGKRAYDLARAGKEFEIQSKKVYIKDIKILGYDCEKDKCKRIKLNIVCGGGTYIRSLCRDIAYKAETLGYMSSLVRTECGGFSLDDAIVIDEFIANPLSNIRRGEELLSKIMPLKDIDKEEYKKVRNGQSIAVNVQDGSYGAKFDGKLCFILKVENNTAKSVCYLED